MFPFLSNNFAVTSAKVVPKKSHSFLPYSLTMKKSGYVYIMVSGTNGTLYIGVTSDLVKRIWQHRTGVIDGFTSTYGCKTLVYFEVFADIADAIAREKAMKKWNRTWKLKRINVFNPKWRDLWPDIAEP